MDKLYRLIRSSDSCCDNATMVSTLKIKPNLFEWEAAPGGLFLSDSSWILLTKNYDRFKKTDPLSHNVGQFQPIQASLTVFECLWHFSVSCAGYYQSFSGWYYQYWPDRMMLVAKNLFPPTNAPFSLLCSSMHTTGAFGDLSAFYHNIW